MKPELDPKDLLEIPDPYATLAKAELPLPNVDALPPAPTRSRTWAIRGLAIAAAIACDAALVGAMGLRAGAGLTPGVVGIGVVLPLVGAAGTFAVLQPSASRKARVLGAIASGIAVFLATALLTQAPGDTSAGAMLRCAIGGTMMTVGPGLLAVFSMRHAFVTGVTWRTAALGLATGLVGAAAMRLHCPNDALAHVVVGHGAAAVVAMLAAAALGSRFTRA